MNPSLSLDEARSVEETLALVRAADLWMDDHDPYPDTWSAHDVRLAFLAGAAAVRAEDEQRLRALVEALAEAVAFLDGGALTYAEQRTLRDGLARLVDRAALASAGTDGGGQ